MARKKKPIDYINDLILNPKTEKLGRKLHELYKRWKKTLLLTDFVEFVETIEKNKAFIGLAQFFGKFRAYSLEEYIFCILQRKVKIPRNLDVYWGEKCLILDENAEKYGMEVDVAVGTKINEFIKPKLVVDAKIELDASRFKTTLASFVLIKNSFPETKCFLVYLKREIDETLLKLGKSWIDSYYCFNPEVDDVERFLKDVNACF